MKAENPIDLIHILDSDIYDLESTSLDEGKGKTKSKKQTKVLLLSHNNVEPYMALVEKMKGAVKIQRSNYVFKEGIEALSDYDFEKCLVFGDTNFISILNTEFNTNLALNEFSESLLVTSPLSEINNNIEAKKALWLSMQKFF